MSYDCISQRIFYEDQTCNVPLFGWQKVHLQTLDLWKLYLQNWCLQARIPAGSNTCRIENLQIWIPAESKTCGIEYLQNWIPAELNTCKHENLQNRIPAELKTFRNKAFKLKYLQLWIPADLNTCSIEKSAELNACEIKYLQKRIEYLQNQIPAELNTIRIIFMENQLPNGGNCQKNPNILYKDQSTQMTSVKLTGEQHFQILSMTCSCFDILFYSKFNRWVS